MKTTTKYKMYMGLLLIVQFVFNACLPAGAYAPTPTSSKIDPASTADLFQTPSFDPPSTSLIHTPITSDVFIQTEWVYGSWNCREYPNAFSDTIINLHDGEQIIVLDLKDNWLFIKAGKKSCWVRSDAIKEK